VHSLGLTPNRFCQISEPRRIASFVLIIGHRRSLPRTNGAIPSWGGNQHKAFDTFSSLRPIFWALCLFAGSVAMPAPNLALGIGASIRNEAQLPPDGHTPFLMARQSHPIHSSHSYQDVMTHHPPPTPPTHSPTPPTPPTHIGIHRPAGPRPDGVRGSRGRQVSVSRNTSPEIGGPKALIRIMPDGLPELRASAAPC